MLGGVNFFFVSNKVINFLNHRNFFLNLVSNKIQKWIDVKIVDNFYFRDRSRVFWKTLIIHDITLIYLYEGS